MHLLRHPVTDAARCAALQHFGGADSAAVARVLALRQVRLAAGWLGGPGVGHARDEPCPQRASSGGGRGCRAARGGARRGWYHRWPWCTPPCVQPELRETFAAVFGVFTNSGNNKWQRGKLLQGRVSAASPGRGRHGTIASWRQRRYNADSLRPPARADPAPPHAPPTLMQPWASTPRACRPSSSRRRARAQARPPRRARAATRRSSRRRQTAASRPAAPSTPPRLARPRRRRRPPIGMAPPSGPACTPPANTPAPSLPPPPRRRLPSSSSSSRRQRLPTSSRLWWW